MGTTAKPRKRYRPRAAINGDPIGYATEGARVIDPARAAEIMRICDAQFVNLKRQDNPGFAWRVLADAIALAEQMAHVGICSDDYSRSLIDQALHTLAGLALRQQQTGSWTMHADEIQRIHEGLMIHTIQLRHISQAEYERALARAQRIAHQALAGNASQDTIIVMGPLTNVVSGQMETMGIPDAERAAA